MLENGAKKWLIKTSKGENLDYIKKISARLRTGALCIIYYKRELIKKEIKRR